jgi:hypothetical protein
MLQSNDWRLGSAKPLQCLDPPVPSQHLVVPIHEHRHIEAKTFDTSGDLADLPRAMLPRVLWIEPKRSD